MKGLTAAQHIVKPGGKILLLGECAEGIGSPEFARMLRRIAGTRSFWTRFASTQVEVDQWQLEKLALAGLEHELLFYTPGAAREALGSLAHKAFGDLDEAVAALVSWPGAGRARRAAAGGSVYLCAGGPGFAYEMIVISQCQKTWRGPSDLIGMRKATTKATADPSTPLRRSIAQGDSFWGRGAQRLNADADLVTRPQRTHRRVIDDWLAVALHFNHRGGLVGRDHGQAGEPEAELVLRELDLLAGLEHARREHLGLEAADGDDDFGFVEVEPLGRGRVAGPAVHVNIERVAAAGVVAACVGGRAFRARCRRWACRWCRSTCRPPQEPRPKAAEPSRQARGRC